MKCQRNARMGGRLRLEVLRAVLADQRDPGLGERPELLERHVLDRGEDLDAVRQLAADPREVGADAGGVEAGDQTRHTTPAWRPVTPAVAAVGEEQAVPAHACTGRRRGSRRTPASASWARAIAARSRLRRRGARRGRANARVDLLADLVAAARARLGRSARSPGRRRRLAQRGDALARSRPPPAPRQPQCSAATAPSAASSTGRQSATNTSAGWPASAVAWPSSCVTSRAASRWRAAPSRRAPASRTGSAPSRTPRRRRRGRGSPRRSRARRRS